MDITIRNLDVNVYKRAKAVAALERMNIGVVLTEALKLWMKLKKKKVKKKSLLDLKPISFGVGNENLSQEIDKVLYGA